MNNVEWQRPPSLTKGLACNKEVTNPPAYVVCPVFLEKDGAALRLHDGVANYIGSLT